MNELNDYISFNSNLDLEIYLKQPSMQMLKSSKPVLAKLVEKRTVRISRGYYDLESGKVEFFDKP